LKVVLLCTYPPRLVTDDLIIGSRKTHVSPWNVSLINALSEIDELELFVLGNGTFFKTKKYKKNKINFLYIAKIPIIDKYFPNLRRKRFQKYIDNLNPDIVHGIGNEHLYPWFAMKSNYKNVITIHGILSEIIGNNPTMKDKIRLKLEKKVFFNLKNLISISREISKKIKECNPTANIFSINNAISNNFFNSKYLNKHKTFDVLMVGMINPLKNTDLIVPIVKDLKKKKNNIKICIVGGPVPKYKKYYENILTNIAINNLEKNIIIKGQIENNELPNYYAQSKILLHLSNVESAGMIYPESLSVNTYVVSSNVGNINDLSKIYIDCIFVLEKMSPKYISDVIYNSLKLLDQNSIIVNSSSKVENNFSPKRIAEETANVYKKIYLND